MPPSSSLGILSHQTPDRSMHTQAEKNEITISRARENVRKKEVSPQRIPAGVLTMWNLAMTLFHSGLVVVTLLFGNSDLTVPIYKTNFTLLYQDDNETAWALIPEYVAAGSINLTWLTASFFFLSALFHFLNATFLRAYYLRNLAICRSPTRYLEYTFSAAVMQVLIAYGLGVRERMLLLSVAVLIGITMPFGVWVEDVARPFGAYEWNLPLRNRLLPWFVGNIPQATAWFIVVVNFYDGISLQAPAFVHLILWGEMFLFFTFGFVALYQQYRYPCDFYKGELLFQVLSLVSKGLLGGLLIANVLMLSSFDEIYQG